MSLDLLIAHEDERRRVAEALHEDLAQTLAAAMLGLRRLERSDALDDVHRQLLRVLDDVRGIATALRPPALGQLGLVPALQGLGLTVHAHGVPEPLPEPLRTGVYRLVHEALAGTPRATPALLQLRTAAGRLEVELELDGEISLATAYAWIAALDGSLEVERHRLRAHFPYAAGSVARSTVLPGSDSIAS